MVYDNFGNEFCFYHLSAYIYNVEPFESYATSVVYSICTARKQIAD
jgi:hypothetical protein